MHTFGIDPVFGSWSSPRFEGLRNPFHVAAGYPEYDLLQTGENDYRITLAVPGFTEDEINVETVDRALHIAGQKQTDHNHNQYLHRGIGTPGFQRSFRLPEHVQVVGARLAAGLLHVDLVREVPEEHRPRKIEVSVQEPPRIADAARAA